MKHNSNGNDMNSIVDGAPAMAQTQEERRLGKVEDILASQAQQLTRIEQLLLAQK